MWLNVISLSVLPNIVQECESCIKHQTPAGFVPFLPIISHKKLVLFICGAHYVAFLNIASIIQS